DAIYAAFGEGWTGTEGLAAEAIYLARVVVELLPDEPEAMGLLALMLHAEARRGARRDSEGNYVPLDQQSPGDWDWRKILEAEEWIRRASAYRVPGRFQLEAALQSAHVHRRRTGHSNWGDILQIYDSLVALTASPVAAVNRAVAVAEVHGP